MKIGITGSTGFIGSALCERLAVLDFEVVKLVRKASIHGARVVGDIGPDTDWSGALNGCDVVVHLAGRVHVMREAASDPLALFRKVNTAGTATLAQAACRSGVKRYIYMSSVKVNGEATSCGHAFTEAANPAPQDAYGISKWEAELALTSIAQAHGMGVCEGRARNAGAEPAGIAEAIGLAVAGGAGNGVIHADAAIIKDDPAKAGRPIGDGIIGWGIIVRRHGAIIIGWQRWAGEIV